MTRKETDHERGTHTLEATAGGTSHDPERNRPSKAHSHSGDRIGRDKLAYEGKPTEKGALTNWRPYREGQVKPRKEIERARGTHSLKTTLGKTIQHMERN
jgi:hypothetical protein